MHRKIKWNDIEKQCIDLIKQNMEFDTDHKHEPLIFCEAYYFVKSQIIDQTNQDL